jgi:hypothetical protein
MAILEEPSINTPIILVMKVMAMLCGSNLSKAATKKENFCEQVEDNQIRSGYDARNRLSKHRHNG